MKKVLFLSATMVVAMATLTSCNNAPAENDTSSSLTSVSTELKIAFVEVDTIMSQYTFAKEAQEDLQTKAQNIQNTISSREQAVNAAMAKLQEDVQQNRLTQEQAETRYNAIMKQGQDVQTLNQRLSNEFQTETEKFNEALSDSIQNYLAVYNKDKNYSMILSKVGDNILLADKALDITNEVVAGLNKAYKPAKKDKKSEEKAK